VAEGGEFESFTGATSTYTVADKLSALTESWLEISAWGFVQTTAGVWTTLPCTAALVQRDADGANEITLGGKTFSYGGSPAVGAILRVYPTSRILVAPGKLVAVEVRQVGTATAGAGAPFMVFRRLGFHREQQTNDIDVSV
jgi:hypothetical protein